MVHAAAGAGFNVGMARRTRACGRCALIRFGGHLPRGGYDVDHARHEAETDSAQLHSRLQGDAIRLVLDAGRTVAAAARALGLTESSLRNWVEHARADGTKGKTGLTAEREELARLRKENHVLQEERDILVPRDRYETERQVAIKILPPMPPSPIGAVIS